MPADWLSFSQGESRFTRRWDCGRSNLANAVFGTTQAITYRDRLLCEVAEVFFPELSIAEQAKNIERKLTRYRAGAWQKDRVREECPQYAVGSKNSFGKFFAHGTPISANRASEQY